MTKLEKMLKYVSEHNEFYKNIIRQYGIVNPLDITQYPILTRQQLQENRYIMFSDGYKSKYLNYQLRQHSSSGTSGIPVSVYWDPIDYRKSTLSLWRKRREWYGITASDRYVTFTLPYDRGNKTPEKVFYFEIDNQLLINAASLTSEEAYKIIIEYISEFNPKWIYIQPFILTQLIHCYKRNNYKPPSNLTYIESVGEVLTNQLKMDAAKFFRVPLANLYGSQEHNGIAYECPYGNIHILEDNVYVENGAIITNLNNHAFPLIRYDQGDILKFAPHCSRCKCGTSTQCINIIGGRISQSFLIAGVEINAYSLSEAISQVNNQFNGMILSYLFSYSISTKMLKCDVRIRNEYGNWQEKVIREIEQELYRRLPNDEGLRIVVAKQKEKQFNINKMQILSVTM